MHSDTDTYIFFLFLYFILFFNGSIDVYLSIICCGTVENPNLENQKFLLECLKTY